MVAEVDLIVPMKPPRIGKSRLRGAVDRAPDDEAHSTLVLALAADTLRAARAADGVRRLLVVATDPGALAGLDVDGVELIGENGADGLNSAIRRGAESLRGADPDGIVGALQADLPALRPAELTEALVAAAGRRAFSPDRQGTGTTLLLSAPGQELDPRFGTGSATAHRRSGAVRLSAGASLRTDVDTAQDLTLACDLGLGERTASIVGRACLAG